MSLGLYVEIPNSYTLKNELTRVELRSYYSHSKARISASRCQAGWSARMMESWASGGGTRLFTSSVRTEQLLRDGKCFLSGAKSELSKGAKNTDERKNM